RGGGGVPQRRRDCRDPALLPEPGRERSDAGDLHTHADHRALRLAGRGRTRPLRGAGTRLARGGARSRHARGGAVRRSGRAGGGTLPERVEADGSRFRRSLASARRVRSGGSIAVAEPRSSRCGLGFLPTILSNNSPLPCDPTPCTLGSGTRPRPGDLPRPVHPFPEADMEQGIRNIVLGVAELEPEDPQLAPTLRLAEALGATLHVVHAYHLPDPVLYPYPEMPVFSSEHLKEVEEQTRTRLEAQVQALSRGASIVCRAVPLPAEKAILDVADEVHADLVVVGATRRGTLARTILGTTEQRVVRAAKAPVLVRRREEHDQLRRILFTTDLSDHSEAVYRRGRELTAILGRGEVAEHRVLL